MDSSEDVVVGCDTWQLTLEALFDNTNGYYYSNNAIQISISLCLFIVGLTFIVSSVTGNYSQTDKIWSITPFVYAWILVCDIRTLVMAIVTTIWGIRLTYNFYRRGGYCWPPWDGDEDYRWKLLQDGKAFPILTNKIVWIIFNFGFISLYQNILLYLLIGPSIIVHVISKSNNCTTIPFNGIDIITIILFLSFVIIETIADNQQYTFQIEKIRRRSAAASNNNLKQLDGEYADGFFQSGLFSIVRKPNYASEQAIWITYNLFSIAAGQTLLWNWSIIGCILLCQLFQGSGWITEKITLSKYPKYKEYMKNVPLYVPNPFRKRRYIIDNDTNKVD